jgi:glycosyltransferase involved in cell wall biosynthesis
MSNKMHIGLDITQVVKARGRGIARYIREILPRIAHVAPELDTTYCIRSDRWWRRGLVQDLVPEAKRAWIPFPIWMSTGGLDLFHSFGNHLPAISRVPLSFTIHDFRALDRPPDKGMGGDRLRRNIERANGIICLTEHGRNRLLHHYPERKDLRVAVIPHGVDHSVFRPQDPDLATRVALRLGLKRPFLIQLGSWFPHKNLELSIRAFARSRAFSEGYQLAFVGGGASAEFSSAMHALAAKEGVEDAISWLENVGTEDLPPLLAAAACLLQPSRYEGFALPLLESMAVGLPGVVSDSSCLPEVSGGLWPVAGQDNAEEFAAALDLMSLPGAERDRAIRQGLEHAEGFTWEATAKRTVRFFSDVLTSID